MADSISKDISSNVVELSWPDEDRALDPARITGNSFSSMALSLKSADRSWSTKEAKRDFNDATRLVSRKIQTRSADREGLQLLAESLDGQSPDDRSSSQEMSISDLLDDVSLQQDDLNPFDAQGIEIPPVHIATSGADYEIANGSSNALLPENVSAAFVQDPLSGEEGVLVDGSLGFREMQLAARFVYGMVLGREAQSRGVEVKDGPIGERFAIALDGGAVNFSDYPELFVAENKPTISASYQNQVFDIASEDYIEASAFDG